MRNPFPPSPFSTRLSGSAREVELRIRNIFQWKKERPPVWLMVLMAAICLSCGSLVSCQVSEASPSGAADLAQRLQYDPDSPFHAFLDSLELDGTGDGDDAVFVLPGQGEDTSSAELTTQVTVLLGTGQELTWDYPYPCFPHIIPLYLTSSHRQSLVIEMDDRTSNYGAAVYFILEVRDGALAEAAHIGLWDSGESGLLADQAVLDGALVRDREDSPLQALRVPVLVDKWHAPCYHTLTWDGAQFSTVSDGYFTDTQTLSLPDGGALTLELTGEWSSNDWGGWELYYSQVRVLDGDVPLQTITPEFPLPAPRTFDADTAAQVTPPESSYPPFGFSADTMLHSVDLRDVNFDGFPDLGLPCDTTHNDVHAWYLWDPSSRQFQYAFALQGDLTVDPERQLLIENRWEAESHLYSFSAYGHLVWMGPEEL